MAEKPKITGSPKISEPETKFPIYKVSPDETWHFTINQFQAEFLIYNVSPEETRFYTEVLDNLQYKSCVLSKDQEAETVKNIISKKNISPELDNLNRGCSIHENEIDKSGKRLIEIENYQKKQSPDDPAWQFVVNYIGYFLIFSLYAIALLETNLFYGIMACVAIIALFIYLPIRRAKRKKRNIKLSEEAIRLKQTIDHHHKMLSKKVDEREEKAWEIFRKHKNLISQHKVLTYGLTLNMRFLTFVSLSDWIRSDRSIQLKKIVKILKLYGCESEIVDREYVVSRTKSGIKFFFLYDGGFKEPGISKLEKFYMSSLDHKMDYSFYISNKEFSKKGRLFAREYSINLLSTEQFIYMVVQSYKDPILFPIRIYLEDGSKRHLESWIEDLSSRHEKTFDSGGEFLLPGSGNTYGACYRNLMQYVDFGLTCIFDQKPITESVLEGVEESTIKNFQKIIQHG